MKTEISGTFQPYPDPNAVTNRPPRPNFDHTMSMLTISCELAGLTRFAQGSDMSLLKKLNETVALRRNKENENASTVPEIRLQQRYNII